MDVARAIDANTIRKAQMVRLTEVKAAEPDYTYAERWARNHHASFLVVVIRNKITVKGWSGWSENRKKGERGKAEAENRKKELKENSNNGEGKLSLKRGEKSLTKGRDGSPHRWSSVVGGDQRNPIFKMGWLDFLQNYLGWISSKNK